MGNQPKSALGKTSDGVPETASEKTTSTSAQAAPP
jgi:hypothetical protein